MSARAEFMAKQTGERELLPLAPSARVKADELAAVEQVPVAVPEFFDTARGMLVEELASQRELGEAVTFYSEDGEYTTRDPGEINRLRLSRTHFESRDQLAEAEVPEPPVDTTFYADAHTVAEVLDFLSANPAETDRILAEEKVGKKRDGILGKAPATES